jgi:hypothetical protein
MQSVRLGNFRHNALVAPCYDILLMLARSVHVGFNRYYSLKILLL